MSEERGAPESLEAEQATLGSMIVDAGAVTRALAETSATDFYREPHQIIFAAIAAVHAASNPVDMVTVGDELRRVNQLEQIGGAEYLSALIGQVPTTQHVVRYSRMVHEKKVKRELMRLAEEIQNAAREDPKDLAGLLTWAGSTLSELSRGATLNAKGAEHVDAHFNELADRLRHALNDAPGVSAARTGIENLDWIMGGLARKRLIVPRAPTKGLKSVFTLQCLLASACEFAKRDTGQIAVYYALEDVETIEERAVAWLSMMDSDVFEPHTQGTEESQRRLEAGLEAFRALPFYYTASLRDIDAITLDLRRKAEDAEVGIAAVDHAQRIAWVVGAGESITVKGEYQSVELARLAEELHCPFVVPSQLTVRDGGEKITKWSRAWTENCTWSFDIERGLKGARREDWLTSNYGRFVLDAARKKSPFGVHEFYVDLATGHMSDDRAEIERAKSYDN